MTEQEWLACTAPWPMLEFLRHKVSDRKLRLFACICCREVWRQLPDERSHKAVEVAERYADGAAAAEVLTAAWQAAASAPWEVAEVARQATSAALWATAADAFVAAVVASRHAAYAARDAAWALASHAAGATTWNSPEIARDAAAWRGVWAVMANERADQAALLRCIFGTPFRSITLDPAWLPWHDGLLVSMAQRMYDARDFADMPVLADALEDAGCTNQDILGHCRSGGEHVRGCWVVDLVMGKS